METENDPLVAKCAIYKVLISGTYQKTDRDEDITCAVAEWSMICDNIFEAFKKEEENRNWEPKVSRVGKFMKKNKRKMMSAEWFTAYILIEVFFMGYGEYYFKQRCKDYFNAKSIVEAVKIDTEIWNWLTVWYGKCKDAREEALQLINDIGDELQESTSNKVVFNDDKNDPEVEVWRWNLYVPVWRIMFEYKRVLIDRRIEEEKRAGIVEKINENVKICEAKTCIKSEEKKVTVDRKKPVPIEFKFNCKKETYENNIVVDLKMKKDEKVLPPMLIKCWTETGL
jgi:hypothetical protein